MTEEDFFRQVQAIGGQGYLVGGAVRAQVLAMASQDRDYLVCGLDEERFRRAFPEAQRIGRAFPVFLVEIGDARCEVAFARRERKTGPGSRGFATEFSPQVTLEEDLFRRDCTVNAMALNSQGRLIDPYGGRADGQAKVLRALSDHFLEDPLRALRAARQAAQFGLTIEAHTLALMNRCGPELRQEAPERKFQELRRALELPQPSGYFRNLQAAGLLEQEFPWLHRLRGQTQPAQYHPEGDAYDHSLAVLDALALRCPRPEVRFAALFHDVGKGLTPPEMLPHHWGHDSAGAALIPQIAAALRLPKRWRDWAIFTAREHMRVHELTRPHKIREILCRLQRPPLSPEDFAVLVESDRLGRPGQIPLWLREPKRFIEAMKYRGDVPSHLQGLKRGLWIQQQEIAQLKEALQAPAKKGTL